MLSVILPVVHADAAYAAEAIEQVRAHLDIEHEIIIVLQPEDSQALDDLDAQVLTCERGKWRAIKHAAAHAKHEWLWLLDADLDYDPAFFDEELLAGDIVIGSRFLDESHCQMPASRRVASRAYRLLAKRLLGLPYSDLQTGCKLVRRCVLLDAEIHDEEFVGDTELLVYAHRNQLDVRERPVSYVQSTSSLRLVTDGACMLWSLVKLASK